MVTNKSPTQFTCSQFTYFYVYDLHILGLSRPPSGRNQIYKEKCIKLWCVTSLDTAARVCIAHSSELHIYNMNID